uniref:Uncharacterized protein n=1 Tax=Glycine max TaxID=3847 RepID=C6TNR5_SOYBN|nr:unknown [Glycine max]
MSTSKKLYAGKKKKGLFHHSSFLAGGATVAAGRLEAEHGILKSISAYSGHYRPTNDALNSFISYLKENGVDIDEVEIRNPKDDTDIYEDGKLSEIATAPEDSSNGNIPELGVSEEADNTTSSNTEEPQLGSVGSYKDSLWWSSESKS